VAKQWNYTGDQCQCSVGPRASQESTANCQNANRSWFDENTPGQFCRSQCRRDGRRASPHRLQHSQHNSTTCSTSTTCYDAMTSPGRLSGAVRHAA